MRAVARGCLLCHNCAYGTSPQGKDAQEQGEKPVTPFDRRLAAIPGAQVAREWDPNSRFGRAGDLVLAGTIAGYNAISIADQFGGLR